ncbi:MAG: hypothetical protein AMR96_07250 [Candidatus Adiutrix intracellularis]|nr:MAG: hypothetical protein AMR96_07250 [Candidatus Adiutrix intracellularis]MDR2827091.1 hypothetical protein [Candidatus Adiutrix intracellularis]
MASSGALNPHEDPFPWGWLRPRRVFILSWLARNGCLSVGGLVWASAEFLVLNIRLGLFSTPYFGSFIRHGFGLVLLRLITSYY